MELEYKLKNGWELAQTEDKEAVYTFCEGYKDFLSKGKTERLCADYVINLAQKNGFSDLDSLKTLKKGDKVYINNRGKCVMLAVIGEKDITEGIRLVAAHIDAPRLDLKQNPLYEDTQMALLKTHYYGGIKKYQWTTIPLALHGVFVKANGEKVNISIGEEENEPVFCITDLLPHLAKDQASKKLGEAISGESLNILVGSKPEEKEDGNVKAAILKFINEKYGVCEEDFLSAEIEAVPAGKARDLGFDKSMIGAYGHDDRVCSYGAFMGLFETENPTYTSVCLLADKEEIGSMGTTGMQSDFFATSLAEIISKTKEDYSDLYLRKALKNSKCLSADVCAATDPNYKEVSESLNSPMLNHGVTLMKFTGSRGKSGSSDASAEFFGEMRKLCRENNVVWQSGELGKVDQGGGGTVAQFIANLNVDTIDAGVPVLSMHAPFEVVGKMDVYMAYKLYKVFYR